MDATQAIEMAGSAVVGAAVTLVAFYRFFVPRDRCDQRHKQVHELANRDAKRETELHELRETFVVLRRDVRWQGATLRAVAEHLGIVVPEEPPRD